ncbi:MAG TPA: MG2 domain-containing protein [Gemmatimonadaceae bacterium]
MSALRLTRSSALALLALFAAAPRMSVAQGALHVLRFQPDSAASPIAPVVISFDRPVAPNLDESVDPTRLLTISPAPRHHVYWRDPSTLVAEFSSPWGAGSTYEVRLDPSLRSADGLPLNRVAAWRVRVQYPRVLAVVPADAKYLDQGVTDPHAHLFVVYSDSVDANALKGRVWYVPNRDCASRDSVPLAVLSTRRLASTDPHQLTFAGGYDRDQRLDSLRRVVELRSPVLAPRGCVGELRSPMPGSTEVRRDEVRIIPAFSFVTITTRSVEGVVAECAGARCEAGPVSLGFSQRVSLSDLEAHLRINGRAPHLAAVAYGSGWQLPDTLHAGEHLHITVDGSLTSQFGDRLVAPVDTSITGRRSKPALGYAKGQVALPRGSPVLLRVRYASTESVRIVIARVADSARGHALSYISREWEDVLWSKLAADSMQRVVAVRADSLREQVLDIPVSWLPESWRADPLFLVRAEPIKAVRTPAPTRRTRDGVAHIAPVVVYAEGERAEPRFAVVQRSDLAAHSLLRDDALDVWVTRRSTGAPVLGARVVVYGPGRSSLGAATTDGMGIARIRELSGPDDLPSLEARYADVTLAGDRVLLALPIDAVRRSEEGRAPADRQDLVTPPARMGVMHGVAFSDRGIYRPGERVYVKGMARLRFPDARIVVPQGDSARWTLSYEHENSQETIATRVGRLTEFGTRSDSFDLPATARVGWYRASLALRAPGGWRSVANAQFGIAEYRVPEFAVRATADTVTPLYAGDSATFHVHADYLFGPPMTGATVTAAAHVEDSWGAIPQLPALRGYRVGRWNWFDDASKQEQDPQPLPATLGADGSLALRVPIRRRIMRPATLSVSVDVVDANRQRLAAYASVPVRATDAYVGIRTDPDRWEWTARQPVPLQLTTVNADGTIRAGASVKLVALRESWSEGRWQRDTVWRDSVVSRAEPVRASFVPSVMGWYEIVASVRDDRGRVAESGTYLIVGGNADGRGARPAFSLRLDRRDASAGDTLNAIIEAPEELNAWLRLSQEGSTIWEQLTTLKRGTTAIRVAVPPLAVRFVELQLMAVRAVRPDTTAASVPAVPYFLSENQIIWVTDSARALRVRLAADRRRYQPRDTVRVALDVSNRTGRGLRSEIALWAVDEGVVSLTGYRTPEMLTELLGGHWRPWWIWTSSTLLGTLSLTPPALAPSSFSFWSSRRSVSGATAALTEMVSVGIAPARQLALRQRFATTPFFAGSVVTDSSGHAATSFVLPDNVTTYRLFAVAVDDELRAGSADTTIVSTRPLIVRAAMPRVVRAGDSLYAGAVLTREGEGHTPVELRVSAEGIRVVGESVARDTLVDARARERRFAMRVLGGDSVSVTFDAASASDRDAVLARLPVSSAGRPRAYVAMGSMRSTGAVELDLPEGIDVTRSRLVLRSGLTPAPLLRELDARLRVYPYACSEQLSSMGRALLARVRLERSLGDTTLAPDDRRRLELVTHELLDRQRHDGGFGYWSASHWTTPWLTSYALDVLVGAREVGIAVPQGALDKARKYLGDDSVMVEYTRRNWLAGADTIYWPHEALHAARMLRRLGHPDVGLEAKVWALRAKLDFEDRLTLALLQSDIGNAPAARQLVDLAWRSTRVEGRRVVIEDSVVRRRWLFRSVTGATVALLRATTVVQPDHPLLGALLESVLQSARSDAVARWNTIDQAAVADAIAAVVAPLGLREGRRLTVTDPHGAKRTLEIAPRGEDSLSLPLASYVVSNGGRRSIRAELGSSSMTAPTYYAMTLYEVPLARPVTADQEGISVERWYESYLDGKPVLEVKEGDLVRVRLRITVPRDREFVVIDDALPAGLEAVDQTLRTTGSLPPYEGAARLEGDAREGPVAQRWLYGSWDAGWWTPWEHKEIRDDRVLYFARQLWRGSYQASYVARATTAGVFVRPPVQAEEMYNPAVRGRSDGGLFTVRSVSLPLPR